jgi:Response regulators consisting of a CheY-like receiver domain and a winged-helix DNA-binding domain
MKVLIVEDDSTSRKLLFKLLSQYGECDQVIDGLEAMDAFMLSLREKDPYDLICLDIMIPKVDGLKVLKAIRDLETQRGFLPRRRVKIILATVLAETERVKNALEIGCDGYLPKPIDANKLKELLKDLGLISDEEL